MFDQYVVNARLKEEDKMTEFPRLVTRNLDEALDFDVSAYEFPWEVWIEHYIVDENCEVITSRESRILFPV